MAEKKAADKMREDDSVQCQEKTNALSQGLKEERENIHSENQRKSEKED